jgi:hypothetical protein
MRCVAGLSIMWLWTGMGAKITNTAAFAKNTMRVIFDELDNTQGIVWVWRRSAVESVERNA